MIVPEVTCGSYSSRSSIVVSWRSRSSRLAKRRDPRPTRVPPAPGADGTDRDHWDRGVEHRVARPEQDEVGPRRERLAPLVHNVLVRDVRVREDDLVDLELTDKARELALVVDPDAVRVAPTGELGRVDAIADERDLRSRERDDLVAPIVSIVDV